MRGRDAVIPLGLSAALHAAILLGPLARTHERPPPPPVPLVVAIEFDDENAALPRAALPGPASTPRLASEPPVAMSERSLAPETPPALAAGRPDAPTPVVEKPAREPARKPAQSEASLARDGESSRVLEPAQAEERAAREMLAASASASPSTLVPALAADTRADALAGLPAAPRLAGPGPGAPARFDPQAYALVVRTRIELQKRYPARARRLGQEGIAVVHVLVAPSGQLRGVPAIVTTSGSDALDREAVRMASAAAPFAPHAASRILPIDVPVRFFLDTR